MELVIWLHHACVKPYLFLVLLLLKLSSRCCQGKVLTPIYWNSTNPIFRKENSDHMYTVNIRDKVDIICPYNPPGTPYEHRAIEYSEIYQVEKWNYDNCQLDESNLKIVGVCKQPLDSGVPITVVFREFTPKPGGLEFKVGHVYYFTSTSTGSYAGLSNRAGGLCSNKNMKLKFVIADGNPYARPLETPKKVPGHRTLEPYIPFVPPYRSESPDPLFTNMNNSIANRNNEISQNPNTNVDFVIDYTSNLGQVTPSNGHRPVNPRANPGSSPEEELNSLSNEVAQNSNYDAFETTMTPNQSEADQSSSAKCLSREPINYLASVLIIMIVRKWFRR